MFDLKETTTKYLLASIGEESNHAIWGRAIRNYDNGHITVEQLQKVHDALAEYEAEQQRKLEEAKRQQEEMEKVMNDEQQIR